MIKKLPIYRTCLAIPSRCFTGDRTEHSLFSHVGNWSTPVCSLRCGSGVRRFVHQLGQSQRILSPSLKQQALSTTSPSTRRFPLLPFLSGQSWNDIVPISERKVKKKKKISSSVFMYSCHRASMLIIHPIFAFGMPGRSRPLFLQ